MQSDSGMCHPKTFTGMLEGNPSTKRSGLISSYHSEESNAMVAKAMEEYELASALEAYDDPGGHAPMGFMAAGGGFHVGNNSKWWEQKHPSFPARLAQRTLTGRPTQCTQVRPKRL